MKKEKEYLKDLPPLKKLKVPGVVSFWNPNLTMQMNLIIVEILKDLDFKKVIACFETFHRTRDSIPLPPIIGNADTQIITVSVKE